MASVSHKGAISFGLVHIPVSFYTATREQKISYNQLHRDTHQRIRYKKVLDDGTEVKQEDIVRGYEIEKGKYVIMEDDDFEAIKTPLDKSIQILHFADIEEVDPIYFEKAFYVVPDGGGEQAFELLRTAMLQENKIAIARTVIRTSETLVALVPGKNGILAETLFYAEEIQPMPKAYAQAEVEQNQLEVAKSLINAMVQPFEPAAYKNEYYEREMEAIQKKAAGQKIVAPKQETGGNVISLMEALQKSLEQKKPAKRPSTRKRAVAK